MKFDIYGRYVLEVVREHGGWVVYRVTNERRRREPNLIVPDDMTEDRIATYLDDMLHEAAGSGDTVRRID